MTKKHYLHITVCALLVVISAVLFSYYYKTYIAPESFVIGSVEYEDYKLLPIKDYLSDEDVIFSQNINDVSFASSDGTAKYEYNFDAKEFNGIENNYIIYVNDYMINTNPSDVNAGTISGVYKLNYYDVDKKVLCASDITISFSFYSLASKLQVSLNASDLGYLMNYFKTDNFIITLAKNPYIELDKDETVEIEWCSLYISSEKSFEVSFDNGETWLSSVSGFDIITNGVHYSKELFGDCGSVLVKSLAQSSSLKSVTTDGEYTTSNIDSDTYLINWTDASYVDIVVFGSNATSL